MTDYILAQYFHIRSTYEPIAMNISFTLLAVFADVSMKSKPLSSAYA